MGEVVQLGGCRAVNTEVIFADMEPRQDGTYEPLVGYTVLQLANVVIDMRRHCLVARKAYALTRIVRRLRPVLSYKGT